MNTPVADARAINELLARYGVKFGIYKNGSFKEQLFPFDAIPRVITAEDFADMEKGLVQRVDALNMFLADIYSDGKIIRDGIIPEDFVYISKGYLAPCAGVMPPKGIYSHISGIDLVQAKDGECIFLRIICVYRRGRAIRLLRGSFAEWQVRRRLRTGKLPITETMRHFSAAPWTM